MKKSLRFVVPLLLLVLVFFGWKWTHPTLSDQEQIRAALDGLAAQASHKNSSGVTSFLTKDFQMDGLKKKDLRQQLTVGMLQYAVVNLKITSVQAEVNGDSATTRGRYELGLKQEFSSPEQKTSSDFVLKWKREDGQWKISDADGNKLPPGLAGG